MDECSICLLPLSKDLLSLDCKHTFCSKCIVGWLKIKNTCPMCGFKVAAYQKPSVSNQTSLNFQEKKHSILANLNHINTALTLKRKQSHKIKSTISKSDIFRFQSDFCEIEKIYFDLCCLNLQQNIMESIALIEQLNFKIIRLEESMNINSGSLYQPLCNQKLKIMNFDDDFPEIEAPSSKSKKFKTK